MQLPQERQTGRGLPVEQDDDEREGAPRLHPPVERLVIFGDLPLADAMFADEQKEGVRLSEFLRELIRPGAAGAQVRRGEKDACRRVLAREGGLEPLGERLVRRMIAEKPARHPSLPSRPRAYPIVTERSQGRSASTFTNRTGESPPVAGYYKGCAPLLPFGQRPLRHDLNS